MHITKNIRQRYGYTPGYTEPGITDPHWANVIRLFNAQQGTGNLPAVCQKTGVSLNRLGTASIIQTGDITAYNSPGAGASTQNGWQRLLGAGPNPSDPVLDMRNIDWTVESVIRLPSSYFSWRSIYSLARMNQTAFSFVINNNKLSLDLSQINVATSAESIPLNEWVHVAATRSGTTVKLFINGTETNSTTGNASFSGGSNTWEECLGGWILDQSNWRWPLGGDIDVLRVTKNVARYTGNFIPPLVFPTA